MNRYIQRLIDQGEHIHQDFKYAITDAKKIARTFSAFANTEGGRILVGVKDNGTIAGIRSDEEVYMLESAAHVFCEPAVIFTYQVWNIAGKQVLEVEVKESQQKPHLAPWKDSLKRAFVRIADENYLANAIQVEVWRKKRMSKPVLIEYSLIEKKLLTYLQKNKQVSMRMLCKHCSISYSKAKRILSNLVAIGIVLIEYNGTSASYSLVESFEQV